MTHTCPNCQYSWSDDDDDELAKAIKSDATTFRVEVLPMREPITPEDKVLRAEIGVRPS